MRWNDGRLHLVVLLTLAFLDVQRAMATTYYVSTNGSDSAAGTNCDTAFLTISNAVAIASPSDNVQVSNGTYTISQQIIVSKAITIQGFGGASNTVVQSGFPASTNRLFTITDANAVVDGFTITNGYTYNENGAGVQMTAGTLQNCVVSGCTCTNTGPQARGGGVWMSGGTISNCTIAGNWACGVISDYTHVGGGGGIYLINNGLVRDSQLIGNTAHAGGGVYLATGAGVLSNCTLRGNVATLGAHEPPGGGVYAAGGSLLFCTVVSNSASGGNANGGGLCGGGAVVRNCTFRGNTATAGGGVYFPAGGTLQNCLITGNSAQNGGGVGGQWGETILSCTIAGNSAAGIGGGVCSGQIDWRMSLQNSIVYYNTAPSGPNHDQEADPSHYFTNIYSCTVPAILAAGGTTNNPQFVNVAGGDYRLMSISPCINTGTNQTWMTNAVDMTGNPRIVSGVVDMGAYEFKTNALQCTFVGSNAVGFVPLPVVFTAYVSGTNLTALNYQWDYNGDGTVDAQGTGLQVVTNTYNACGSYNVSLVVTNAIGEIAAATNVTCVRAGPSIAYVATNGPSVYPYTNWSMAATNIQVAVDIGVDGTLVLVSNGMYSITSQISITNGVTVRGVNGASNTVVKAPGTANTRVFFLSHPGAVLDGLTITNGYSSSGNGSVGGGVYIQKRIDLVADIGGTVRNCIISGNKADNYGAGVYVWYGGLLENCTISGNTLLGWWYGGGGVYGGTLRNCVIRGNANNGSYSSGGGVYGGTLRNCLVVGNTAKSANSHGGGVYAGTVESCTVCDNSGDDGGGIHSATTVSNTISYFNTNNVSAAATNIVGGAVGYCCAPELIAGTNGNLNANPLFVNRGGGDYRLDSDSPCVNKGLNLDWMTNSWPYDLANGPRIRNNLVDMGAYETRIPPRGTVFTVR